MSVTPRPDFLNHPKKSTPTQRPGRRRPPLLAVTMPLDLPSPGRQKPIETARYGCRSGDLSHVRRRGAEEPPHLREKDGHPFGLSVAPPSSGVRPVRRGERGGPCSGGSFGSRR